MIRRNVPLADSPDKWLLISQVEHARLSAELAQAWGGTLPGVVCEAASDNSHLAEVRAELIAAVLHHDDGWASWEADPEIDPAAARPYSFMELPRAELLPLWRDSVLRARQIGPLAAWVVAGHFERLLHDLSEARCHASERWLAEVVAWRREWLAEWRSLNRPVHTETLAAECLAWLRLFDWFSLWLCCNCPTTAADKMCEPMRLEEGQLQATPVEVTAKGECDGSNVGIVVVTPWCFAGDSLELDALGYAVATRSYQSSGELAKGRTPQRLRWRLVPKR